MNVNLKGYQSSVPDYLRVSVEHQDRENINYPDRIYVVSKHKSWRTVDSLSMSRKNAYEEKAHQLVNRETSPLSPSWMQGKANLAGDSYPREELQRKSVFGQQTRVEENRVLLFDSKQPLLSGDH